MKGLAHVKILAPLHQRDFALLWSGQTVSLAGDGIFTVALALATLRVDSNPSALAVVLAARLIPTVALLIVGGVVVDRVPRRLAMLASDVVRGLAVGALALLAAGDDLTVGLLVGLSVVFGVADAFFYPASTALVPELLPEDQLVAGGALSATSRVLAKNLVGPAAGGIAVAAIGTAGSFAFDAASFAVSATCLLTLRTRARPPVRKGSPLADAREGLRYCRSQRWLWVTIVAAGVANFASFSPLAVLVPLLVRHDLHASASALGLVLAAGGAGGLVATVAVGRHGTPKRPITVMWVGWGASGLTTAFFGVAGDVGLLAAGVAATYSLLMVGNGMWNPLMQRLVPREMLGRASSVDWLVSLGLSPLGIIAAGALAGTIGTRATIVVGGGIAACCGLCLLIPGVRDPDRG